MSRSEAARRAGVTPQTVRRWAQNFDRIGEVRFKGFSDVAELFVAREAPRVG